MQRCSEVDQIAPGLLLWQAYDSNVKADLFSTALKTANGVFAVDPIPLSPAGLLLLRNYGKPAGIFVTNANHVRGSAELAKSLSVNTSAHESLQGTPHFPQGKWVQDGEKLAEGLTAVAIDGGPLGETALHYCGNGGTVIFGDALINFDPYGFTFLPDKYCQDAKLMRKSLRRVLNYAFERILFAHGTPILSNGRARLEELLQTVP